MALRGMSYWPSTWQTPVGFMQGLGPTANIKHGLYMDQVLSGQTVWEAIEGRAALWRVNPLTVEAYIGKQRVLLSQVIMPGDIVEIF